MEQACTNLTGKMFPFMNASADSTEVFGNNTVGHMLIKTIRTVGMFFCSMELVFITVDYFAVRMLLCVVLLFLADGTENRIYKITVFAHMENTSAHGANGMILGNMFKTEANGTASTLKMSVFAADITRRMGNVLCRVAKHTFEFKDFFFFSAGEKGEDCQK